MSHNFIRNGLRSCIRVATLGVMVSISPGLNGATAAETSRNSDSDNVPRGVSARDWAHVQAAYEAKQHAIQPAKQGYFARNPNQSWLTWFDGRGFVTIPNDGAWSWGLQLVGYCGCDAGCAAAPACVQVDGHRIAYEWNDTLTEWFVNDQRGMEHGFTFSKRPSALAEHLQLDLAVRGDLHIEISDAGREASFVAASGASVVNYSGLVAFDATGRVLRAWVEPTPGGFRVFVDDAGALYPLTIDPVAQQAYLKADRSSAFFGEAVAVSEDTVVVGALNEGVIIIDPDGNPRGVVGVGAAYVFVREGAGWRQQARFEPPQIERFTFFGVAVAIAGDVIVVGADSRNSMTDTAYVFERVGESWIETARLQEPHGSAFASSVAVSGETIVVGDRFESSNATGVNGDRTNSGATGAGAVYVYTRDGGTWREEAYIKASDTRPVDHFGTSVAISGDTIVVGAPDEDSNATGVNGDQGNINATDAGAAYVFVRSGGTWAQQAYVKASNTGSHDQFGFSVAVSDDTMIVGALAESSDAAGVNGDQSNNNRSASGAAYVFIRDDGVWTQQAYLKAANPSVDDEFGYAVAISGDIAVVGSLQEDSRCRCANSYDTHPGNTGVGFDAGAAYVFNRSGSDWTQTGYLKASNTNQERYFGASVAVSGDTIVIGQPYDSSESTGVNGEPDGTSGGMSGAAFVYTTNGPAHCPADFNCDNKVGINDLAFLLSYYGYTNRSPADVDGDLDTDIDDLTIMLSVFGSSNCE